MPITRLLLFYVYFSTGYVVYVCVCCSPISSTCGDILQGQGASCVALFCVHSAHLCLAGMSTRRPCSSSSSHSRVYSVALICLFILNTRSNVFKVDNSPTNQLHQINIYQYNCNTSSVIIFFHGPPLSQMLVIMTIQTAWTFLVCSSSVVFHQNHVDRD